MVEMDLNFKIFFRKYIYFSKRRLFFYLLQDPFQGSDFTSAVEKSKNCNREFRNTALVSGKYSYFTFPEMYTVFLINFIL